jgi:class 3 adenylate cyclase/pimeloyl-ACP methyl ester carboxylesterase
MQPGASGTGAWSKRARGCQTLSMALTRGGMRIPDTLYAMAGDAAIAYQVYGSGEHRVVGVPGMVSNVEVSWEWSPYHHWVERWGSFATVVAFDKRGTGCSDRVEVPASLEERMNDFHVVLDAVGWERATISAISEGGAVACLFAATYPERTESLILQGCFARSVRAPGYEFWVDRATYDRFWAAIAQHWGTPETRTIPFMAPSQVGDDAFLRWWMRYERLSSTPRDFLAAAALNADVDVRRVLPAIRVPTLVVQARQDRVVPVEHGRYLAANIPGATLFEYDGETFPMFVGVDESMDAIEAFVAGSVRRPAGDRVLATVLFTDICGSTERAASLGDHDWRALLDRHDEVLRVALERHGGVEVSTTGDGMLSTFDSPARAVRCALDMIEAARATGLDIRAGVHTGEVERRGEDLVGMAVHIGARVAALAGPGDVLVSGAVPPLVVGSGLDFADHGEHELKGVAGAWRLFVVKGPGGR